MCDRVFAPCLIFAASSRSGSPSSRLSYLTHVNSNASASSSSRPRRKSGIPRSQGASREGSPSRITYGKCRYPKKLLMIKSSVCWRYCLTRRETWNFIAKLGFGNVVSSSSGMPNCLTRRPLQCTNVNLKCNANSHLHKPRTFVLGLNFYINCRFRSRKEVQCR